MLGAVGMVTLTVGLFWLVTDPSFRVGTDGVRVEGVRYAEESAVLDHLSGLARRPNVFRVRASEIVSDLRALPQVSSAAATVTLPANVSVSVTEREPLFQWSDGKRAWLVDSSGVLFAAGEMPSDAETDEEGEADDPGSAAAADEPVPGPAATATIDAGRDAAAVRVPSSVPVALPIVEDARLVSEPPGVGSRLSDIDVAVIRQLLAVTPGLLSSKSAELQLRIDQRDGYVLRSDELGWRAVFGHYTPTLQPPETVARQVQCLSWLLNAREAKVQRVRLAVSDTGCGTFTRVGRAG